MILIFGVNNKYKVKWGLKKLDLLKNRPAMSITC